MIRMIAGRKFEVASGLIIFDTKDQRHGAAVKVGLREGQSVHPFTYEFD